MELYCETRKVVKICFDSTRLEEIEDLVVQGIQTKRDRLNVPDRFNNLMIDTLR